MRGLLQTGELADNHDIMEIYVADPPQLSAADVTMLSKKARRAEEDFRVEHEIMEEVEKRDGKSGAHAFLHVPRGTPW